MTKLKPGADTVLVPVEATGSRYPTRAGDLGTDMMGECIVSRQRNHRLRGQQGDHKFRQT